MPTGVGGMLFGGGGGAGSAAPVQVGGGKNAQAQNLGSPHSGLKSTVTKGDPLSRSMGQYGKGHSFTAGASPLKQIRGGLGQMRRIRGGLGPGKMGEAGPSNQDYSMKNADTE
jgi:hypothetical protein